MPYTKHVESEPPRWTEAVNVYKVFYLIQMIIQILE